MVRTSVGGAIKYMPLQEYGSIKPSELNILLREGEGSMLEYGANVSIPNKYPTSTPQVLAVLKHTTEKK